MSSEYDDLLKAARDEAQQLNYEKAIELAKKQLKLTDCPGNRQSEKDRIETLYLLAEVSNLTGNWSDSLMYLNMIKPLGEYKRSLPVRVETTIKIANIFANTGKWDNALALYDEAYNSVKGFQNQNLLAQALVGKSIIYWRTGQNTFSINFGKQALDLAKDIGDDELIGKCAAVLSNAWSECNEYDKSLEASVVAEEAYRRAGNRFDTARVLSNRGEIYRVLEQYEDGIEVFEKAIAENQDWNYDNAFMKSLILINLATCQAKAGRTSEAEKTAREADRTLESSEDKYSVAFNNALKGIIASEKGNHAAALKHLHRAQEQILKQSIPYDTGTICVEYADALAKAGQIQEASEKYKEAISFYKEASSMDMAEKASRRLQNLKG